MKKNGGRDYIIRTCTCQLRASNPSQREMQPAASVGAALTSKLIERAVTTTQAGTHHTHSRQCSATGRTRGPGQW